MKEIAINRLWTEKEYKEGGKVVGDSAYQLVFAKLLYYIATLCNMLTALFVTNNQ